MNSKYTFVFLLLASDFFSQQDYYSLYKQVSDSVKKVNLITENYFDKVKLDTVAMNDTVALNKVFIKRKEAYNRVIIPLVKNVINKSFPDISFTDNAFASHYLSDYSKSNIILNYNYLYCKPCVNRIDSTLNLIQNKNIKMIVLLQDIYRKDFGDLSKYEDKIVIGFIGSETRSLISLDIGDDQMYMLGSDRKVIYFDGIEPLNHHDNWLKFLRNYNARQ